METWFAFYHLNDPTGTIVSVQFLTVAGAETYIAGDPTLAYVEAPGDIDPADYYVANDLLFLKPEAPPVVQAPAAPLKTWAFFMTTDANGVVRFTLKGTADDAELSVTDAAMDYLEGPEGMNPADYYVAGGVLTLRPTFSPTLSSTTVVANGIATATISGLPTNTQVTLQTAELSPFATSDTRDFYGNGKNTGAETSFTVQTFHKLPHNFLLEKFPYRPLMVTIRGI